MNAFQTKYLSVEDEVFASRFIGQSHTSYIDYVVLRSIITAKEIAETVEDIGFSAEVRGEYAYMWSWIRMCVFASW